MNMINYLFIALLFLFLSGCTNTDDDKESNEPSIMFPNYLIINAPSKDPNMPWYVSEFAKKVGQWELETTDLGDRELGMYELTQYPNQEATQVHKDAANKLVKDSIDSVVRHGWLSKEKGLSDGYEQMHRDPVYFVNKEYVFDGETLNPDKPEVLMYYKTEEGDFLMGVMFIAVGQRGPQVAGPLSKWHHHIDRGMCYERGVLPIGRYEEGRSCEVGFPNTRSPEMLHVWLFDHPDGRFATKMGLSEEHLEIGIKQVLDL
ncbi:exported protein of unknown function [uncultured Woeseiaceae bacterium]|uniref:Lipoprotein n=1 Tax=uncultured Woeseiaceae bacterium TaxID=1983305 RepID=A0A7D9D238_9GAMM|nr:exported protein of unknown function [uncultured Woeseiaceae bacterium]